MKRLDLKLLRDMWDLKAQVLAIALVMASGVATLILSLSTVDSLRAAQARYYERNCFADVFAHLKRAPDAAAKHFAAIPGVAQVQSRVVVDVTLDIPGLTVPAAARLISLDPDPEAGLNRPHMRLGRLPERSNRGEALVSEAFAQAHGFKPGDRILAIVNGRLQALTVVGIAISPEYVYQIRPGEIIPDDKRFGVFWLDRGELAAAYGLEGAFNDVALTLAPGARAKDVIQALDRLTARYGGQGAHGARTRSHTAVFPTNSASCAPWRRSRPSSFSP